MSKRKQKHPDRRSKKQQKPSCVAKDGELKSISKEAEKHFEWKKLAVKVGIPGIIISLVISFFVWTVQSIYDLKNELACVSTELTCYEEFVGLQYGIGSNEFVIPNIQESSS